MPPKKKYLKKLQFKALRQLQPRYRLPRATEAQVSSESNVTVENVITASVAADNIIMTPTAVSSGTPEPVHAPIDGGDVDSSLAHSESSSALEPITDDMNSVLDIVENVAGTSVADDNTALTPTVVSSEIPELLHVPVDGDGDVGSSLMHSVSSNALEPIINDTNSGSDVAVTPDVSFAADSETPVKPKAKRAKLDTTISEDSSCASDVTDNEKEDKHDKEFLLDTPSRRSGEFCFGNGAFFCQKSQLQHFIDQINKTSRCITENCNGVLKPVSIQMAGFGGTVRIQYDFIERRLTLDSSTVTAHDQSDLSLALQIGFIVAGCSYAQYSKVLAQALGMRAVSFVQFYKH